MTYFYPTRGSNHIASVTKSMAVSNHG